MKKQDQKEQCECFPGFSGNYCNEKDCLFNCSSNGKCNKNGICECFSGYEGEVYMFFFLINYYFMISFVRPSLLDFARLIVQITGFVCKGNACVIILIMENNAS